MNNTTTFLGRELPPVVKHLLIVNVLLWIATIGLLQLNPNVDLNEILGLHYWRGSDFKVWQFVTYMFMHDDRTFSHLFFNMFSLWMFGVKLEQVMKAKRFLAFYLICGIGAGLVQELTWEASWQSMIAQLGEVANVSADNIEKAINAGMFSQSELNYWWNKMVTVGASGAVFGILLAFAWFFPNVSLYFFFIPIPIKAKWVIVIYGVVELYFGLTGTMSHVAHYAHLGGLLFGLIILVYWQKRGILKREDVFY